MYRYVRERITKIVTSFRYNKTTNGEDDIRLKIIDFSHVHAFAVNVEKLVVANESVK